MIRPHLQDDVKRIYDEAASHYDWQHSLLTAGTDNRGRRWVINKTVGPGIHVLDAGAGTGSTGMAAGRIVGKTGSVTLFDLSPKMLNVAKGKIQKEEISCPFYYKTGDLHQLPFEDEHFDTVLSTYSLDPLRDPIQAFKEMYRVTQKGGLIGVAHEVAPHSGILRIISDGVERMVWHVPKLGLACRPVDIIPVLGSLKGYLIDQKRIGVPLWPFQLFVFRKEI